MKPLFFLIAILLVVAAGLLAFHLRSRRSTPSAVAHVENGFEFTVHTPYEKVFPLFGAHGERAWAEGWNPQFLHPQPARDIEGEVFSIAHGHKQAVWINTVFDSASGHVQYVYVIPDVQAVRIDIHFRHDDPSSTEVKVAYERTALTSSLNDHIREMGKKDSQAAAEWQSSTEKYLMVAKAN
jgi:hypothetical protein